MPDRGYIKFYRSIFDHPVFKAESFSEREAWIWLCCEAAWKPRRQRLGDHLVDLQRGEVVGAVRFLAEKWGWTKGKVERFLIRIKNDGMIGTHTGTGITVITICNYDSYQGDGDDDGTAMVEEPGQGRDATGTRPGRDRDNRKKLNTLEERKEGEEDMFARDTRDTTPEPGNALVPVPAKRAKRGPRGKSGPLTPVDMTWVLDEDGRQYARDRGWPDNHIDAQFEKMKNFHAAKGNLMANWPAAWRTWVGNGFDRPRSGAAAGGSGSGLSRRSESLLEGILDHGRMGGDDDEGRD